MKTIALDDIDREILSSLARNGRATYAELGRRAGLSSHAIAPRVRRLVDAGIITGFTATLDYGALGRGLEALVDIRLLSTTDPDEFEQAVSDLPAARELIFLTGRFDYQLRTSCTDADDLDRTIRTLRKCGAAHTETRIILRTHPYRQPVG